MDIEKGVVSMKFCRNCGKKFESENPIFCGDCGQSTSKGSEEANNPKDTQQYSNQEESTEKTEVPVQQVTVEKGLFVDRDVMQNMERSNSQNFHQLHRHHRGSRDHNTTITTILITVVAIALIIGGYLYYQHWQEQKRLLAEQEVFQKDLEDFKYELETQWELIVINTSEFKEKCDNVYNKPTKDMSLQDKLHNFKTEAVAYRKSLETNIVTLDKIQMTDRLINYNDLGDFLSDLLIAVNINIDYCDNIINLCGNPKDAKREAQNKGQDTEEAYMTIYRNKEFKKYFSMDMRITDLDSIGGQVEAIVDDRVKELESVVVQNNQPTGISITINGKNGNVPPPPGFNTYTPTYTAPVSSNYLSKMQYLVDAYLDERVITNKSISKARTNCNIPGAKEVFKQECAQGASARYSICQQAQALLNSAPANYKVAHQQFIDCCLAGYAACQKAHDGIDGYGSNWYEIFSAVSSSNTQTMKNVSNTYKVW